MTVASKGTLLDTGGIPADSPLVSILLERGFMKVDEKTKKPVINPTVYTTPGGVNGFKEAVREIIHEILPTYEEVSTYVQDQGLETARRAALLKNLGSEALGLVTAAVKMFGVPGTTERMMALINVPFKDRHVVEKFRTITQMVGYLVSNGASTSAVSKALQTVARAAVIQKAQMAEGSLSGVGIGAYKGNWKYLGEEDKYSKLGGIPGFGTAPINKEIPNSYAQGFLAREFQGINPKVPVTKPVSQFSAVVDRVTEIVDTDLFKNKEALINYKHGSIMNALNALKRSLKEMAERVPVDITIPMDANEGNYAKFVDLIYGKSDLKPSAFYPYSIKMKALDKNFKGGKDFGLYLKAKSSIPWNTRGEPARRVYPLTPYVNFGARPKKSFEVAIAPYFGYVDTMYAPIKVQAKGTRPSAWGIEDFRGSWLEGPHVWDVKKLGKQPDVPAVKSEEEKFLKEVAAQRAISNWQANNPEDMREGAYDQREATEIYENFLAVRATRYINQIIWLMTKAEDKPESVAAAAKLVDPRYDPTALDGPEYLLHSRNLLLHSTAVRATYPYARQASDLTPFSKVSINLVGKNFAKALERALRISGRAAQNAYLNFMKMEVPATASSYRKDSRPVHQLYTILSEIEFPKYLEGARFVDLDRVDMSEITIDKFKTSGEVVEYLSKKYRLIQTLGLGPAGYMATMKTFQSAFADFGFPELVDVLVKDEEQELEQEEPRWHLWSRLKTYSTFLGNTIEGALRSTQAIWGTFREEVNVLKYVIGTNLGMNHPIVVSLDNLAFIISRVVELLDSCLADSKQFAKLANMHAELKKVTELVTAIDEAVAAGKSKWAWLTNAIQNRGFRISGPGYTSGTIAADEDDLRGKLESRLVMIADLITQQSDYDEHVYIYFPPHCLEGLGYAAEANFRVHVDGFKSRSDWLKYIQVMSWIRNFTYANKMEKSKVNKNRVTSYLGRDTKDLKKLIYTFGGEPNDYLDKQ